MKAKRTLAFMLGILLVVSMITVSAFAVEDTEDVSAVPAEAVVEDEFSFKDNGTAYDLPETVTETVPETMDTVPETVNEVIPEITSETTQEDWQEPAPETTQEIIQESAQDTISGTAEEETQETESEDKNEAVTESAPAAQGNAKADNSDKQDNPADQGGKESDKTDNDATDTGAADNSRLINEIPAADSGYVYFAGIRWHVIGMSEKECLLISDELLLYEEKTMDYAGAEEFCEALYKVFSVSEQEAVLAITKEDSAPLKDAALFMLSSEEAEAYFESDKDREPGYWWLRSPSDEGGKSAGVILKGDFGFADISNADSFGVRPAFCLNAESVIFPSAAEGAKSSEPAGSGKFGSFNAVSENGCKLTIADSSRNVFTADADTSSVYPGGIVSVQYSNAGTAAGEYVSAMITDDNGNIQYYASLKSETGSGTWDITLPDLTVGADYILKVFSEQQNGDHETDYASSMKEFRMTAAEESAENPSGPEDEDDDPVPPAEDEEGSGSGGNNNTEQKEDQGGSGRPGRTDGNNNSGDSRGSNSSNNDNNTDSSRRSDNSERGSSSGESSGSNNSGRSNNFGESRGSNNSGRSNNSGESRGSNSSDRDRNSGGSRRSRDSGSDDESGESGGSQGSGRQEFGTYSEVAESAGVIIEDGKVTYAQDWNGSVSGDITAEGMKGATITANEANGVAITLPAETDIYIIEDSEITASAGQKNNDLGYEAAFGVGIGVETGELWIKNSRISSTGPRSTPVYMFGTAQPDGTSLVVIDSAISSYTDNKDIWMPPFKLLAGGSRATLLMTRNNSWFINSTVTSNNWGAISQDSVEANTYVINSQGIAKAGGYGAYLTYNMYLYASQLYGSQYGAFMCGTSLLQTGTAEDAMADKDAMSKTPDYKAEDQQTVIAGVVNAVVVHTSTPGQDKIAVGNFKDAVLTTMPEDLRGTVAAMAADDEFFMNKEMDDYGISSGTAYFYNKNLYGSLILVRSMNTDFTFDNTDARPFNGVLVQTVLNYDPPQAIGYLSAGEGEELPGTTVTFLNGEYTGDILHQDYQHLMNIVIGENGVLNGAIVSGTYQGWNDLWSEETLMNVLKEDGYEKVPFENEEWVKNVQENLILADDEAYAETENLGASVTVEEGGTWIVTGTSSLSSLTIEEDAVISVPEGMTLTVFVNADASNANSSYEGGTQIDDLTAGTYENVIITVS